MNLEDIRSEYRLNELHEEQVLNDPIKQFQKWFEEALHSKVTEPNAMTLATVDPKGQPDARIVLLKQVNEKGFSFFTNYRSRKGQQLAHTDQVALVFFWPELERQVRIKGKVEKLSFEESDAYFRKRPKGSQIGALASPQSETIADRRVLQSAFDDLAMEYAEAEVPTPAHWGGYLVRPHQVEFWQGRPSRLHDRLLFKSEAGSKWTIERLAP